MFADTQSPRVRAPVSPAISRTWACVRPKVPSGPTCPEGAPAQFCWQPRGSTTSGETRRSLTGEGRRERGRGGGRERQRRVRPERSVTSVPGSFCSAPEGGPLGRSVPSLPAAPVHRSPAAAVGEPGPHWPAGPTLA